MFSDVRDLCSSRTVYSVCGVQRAHRSVYGFTLYGFLCVRAVIAFLK